MHFTRTYGPSLDGEGNPQDQGGAWSADADPAANATPTQAGNFTFWVELNGVKSKVLTLTAVDVVDGGSGAQSGGSSGSTGDGSGKHGGCGSTSGGALLALGALGFVLLRRRR